MFTLLNALFAVSTIISAHSLVDNSLRPTPQFKKLLDLTDIKDGDLQSLVDQTQKEYLRKPGTERWDIDSGDLKSHDEIRQLFDEMGYIQEIKPSEEEYEYVVVFGALASRMNLRIKYLIELIKNGSIRSKKIVFLGSERPAHNEFESAEKLSELFGREVSANEKHTEYTILKELAEKSDLLKIENIEMEVLCAPMHEDGSRAQTADTVALWLSKNPTPGKVLSVSNQPFVSYQLEVAKTLLPEEFCVECCGPKILDSTNDRTILDTIARELYQFNKRINTK